MARIRVAIAHYGLTPEQLFGKPKTAVRTSKTKSVPATWKKTGRVTYSDGHGNHWGGWGKRPGWLREALAAGKRLEDFQVEGVAAPKPAKKVAQKRRPSTVVYTDGAGKSWTGRGPQPRWLKELIASGKTLEELRN